MMTSQNSPRSKKLTNNLLGFPVLLTGDKVFANLGIKVFEFRVKPYTFAMGFAKPFLASPVLDKVKRVQLPGRLTQ